MQIKVIDKHFIPYLSEQIIKTRVEELAQRINADYVHKRPIFIGILNGSFMFAADLYRHITIPSEISFIKLASYKGTTSTGSVITAIGLEEDIEGKDVIILEDIVDTGKTMHMFLKTLEKLHPASVSICTLLQKPDALTVDLKVDYIGFEIPNKFVVGYGLDYDGYGRNSKEIYQLHED